MAHHCFFILPLIPWRLGYELSDKFTNHVTNADCTNKPGLRTLPQVYEPPWHLKLYEHPWVTNPPTSLRATMSYQTVRTPLGYEPSLMFTNHLTNVDCTNKPGFRTLPQVYEPPWHLKMYGHPWVTNPPPSLRNYHVTKCTNTPGLRILHPSLRTTLLMQSVQTPLGYTNPPPSLRTTLLMQIVRTHVVSHRIG